LLSTIAPYDWVTNPEINGWIGLTSLVIGIVAIIIGVYTGYWFYRKAQPLKRITYDILSDIPVMSINRQVGRGNIKIEFKDNSGHTEEISDARLLTLKVWNTGNTDIKIWNANDIDVEDMEEPIEFELDKRTVVSLTEVKTDPPESVINQKQLKTYLNKPLSSPYHVGLPHCLLKQKESIELSVIVKGEGKKIKARGKLLNGKIGNFEDVIHERDRSNNIITLATIAVYLLVVASLLILYQFIPIKTTHGQDSLNVILTYYLVFTSICTFFFWWWVLHRINKPFRCACGFGTHFSGRFKKHVQQSHHQYFY
jgi:hypothetical protein